MSLYCIFRRELYKTVPKNDMKTLLKGFCGIVSPEETGCVYMVNEYFDIGYPMVAGFLHPDTCKMLKLCPATTYEAVMRQSNVGIDSVNHSCEVCKAFVPIMK